MGDAKVLLFPGVTLAHEPAARLCCDCKHAYLGMRGVYCGQYKEEILNEKAAEVCEEYDA